LLLLRALWLAAALTFAYRDYKAEKLLATVLDQKPHTPQAYLAAGAGAVRWFPIDQHIRNIRMWLDKTVAQAEQSNAAGK